jgi:hypothetical protein
VNSRRAEIDSGDEQQRADDETNGRQKHPPEAAARRYTP